MPSTPRTLTTQTLINFKLFMKSPFWQKWLWEKRKNAEQGLSPRKSFSSPRFQFQFRWRRNPPINLGWKLRKERKSWSLLSSQFLQIPFHSCWAPYKVREEKYGREQKWQKWDYGLKMFFKWPQIYIYKCINGIVDFQEALPLNSARANHRLKLKW